MLVAMDGHEIHAHPTVLDQWTYSCAQGDQTYQSFASKEEAEEAGRLHSMGFETTQAPSVFLLSGQHTIRFGPITWRTLNTITDGNPSGRPIGTWLNAKRNP